MNHKQINYSVEELNELLDKVEDMTINRNYKPEFIVSTYWNEVLDTSGNYTMYDVSKIKKDIENWVYHKVDGITMIIHIGINKNENKLFIGADINKLLEYAQLAKNEGLKIHAVKVHKQKITAEDIENTSDFNIQYKALIDNIADNFNNITDRFICFNEFSHMYNNSNNKSFVLDVINSIKNKGFKVGVSTQGAEEMYVMEDEIKQALDILGINHYRYISSKKERTTYNDSFKSWNNSTVLKVMEYLKDKYPNKEIVMTESGVQDYWLALSKPENFIWSDTTSTGGYAQSIYLYGLLLATNVDFIDSVWWWFNFSKKESETAKLLRYFLGGIDYE